MPINMKEQFLLNLQITTNTCKPLLKIFESGAMAECGKLYPTPSQSQVLYPITEKLQNNKGFFDKVIKMKLQKF